LSATTDALAAAKTVAAVGATYLQSLLDYNARRVSLQVIELFTKRMAATACRRLTFRGCH